MANLRDKEACSLYSAQFCLQQNFWVTQTKYYVCPQLCKITPRCSLCTVRFIVQQRCGLGHLLNKILSSTAWVLKKFHAKLHQTSSSAIAEGPRDASCQLKFCQLPRNSAETTSTTSPEQIEVMKLEGYSGPMCIKHVHSTMTWSSRFHCLIGVINKPTTDRVVDITCIPTTCCGEIFLSPQCRSCSRDPDHAPFREDFFIGRVRCDAPCKRCTNVRRIAFDKSCIRRITFKVIQGHWKWHE